MYFSAVRASTKFIRIRFLFLDDDECADMNDNCHADATCTNTAGSFTCACNAGYTGDGVTTGTGCTGKSCHFNFQFEFLKY